MSDYTSLISAMHVAGGVLLLITFLVYEFMAPQLPGILLEVEAEIGHHQLEQVKELRLHNMQRLECNGKNKNKT